MSYNVLPPHQIELNENSINNTAIHLEVINASFVSIYDPTTTGHSHRLLPVQ